MITSYSLFNLRPDQIKAQGRSIIQQWKPSRGMVNQWYSERRNSKEMNSNGVSCANPPPRVNKVRRLWCAFLNNLRERPAELQPGDCHKLTQGASTWTTARGRLINHSRYVLLFLGLASGPGVPRFLASFSGNQNQGSQRLTKKGNKKVVFEAKVSILCKQARGHKSEDTETQGPRLLCGASFCRDSREKGAWFPRGIKRVVLCFDCFVPSHNAPDFADVHTQLCIGIRQSVGSLPKSFFETQFCRIMHIPQTRPFSCIRRVWLNRICIYLMVVEGKRNSS